MGTGAIGHVKLSILPRRLLDGAHFSKKRCRWGWPHMIRRLAPLIAATYHNHYICHASHRIAIIGMQVIHSMLLANPHSPATLHANLLLAHAGPSATRRRHRDSCRMR